MFAVIRYKQSQGEKTNMLELWLVTHLDGDCDNVYASDVKTLEGMVLFYRDGDLEKGYSIRNIVSIEKVDED